MKDKHISIPSDQALLDSLYRAAETELRIDRSKTALFIALKFAVYFTLSAALYVSLYFVQNPYVFMLCFVLYGFASLLFAFNFAHDFSHNTVFKSKRLNNAGYTLIYTLLGAHAEAWKDRHVHSHHFAPNVEGYDSDLKISKMIRVVPGSPWHWYHRFQAFYAPLAYTTYSLFWVFIKDFVILFSPPAYGERKDFAYYASFFLQKIAYLGFILVLPLAFAQQPWHIVLIGFLCMHLSQSLFLLFTFFMTHHVEGLSYPTVGPDGYINASWTMNQIQSSNDMHPFSEIANFIFGGFNNHIAHHLFPHYHHVHYPRLSRIIYGILMKNGITPHQTSYWGGIVSHMRLLARMGRGG